MLVGKVRVNSSVSDQVAKYFQRFPSSMDRIEIYDNSIPNDPAPPCKAAAVIHRSSLVNGTIPCVTVLKQAIFDYSNRDFHKFQLQYLVDSVATKYLNERGGGIQLCVHRHDVRWPSSWSSRDLESYSKALEIGQHANLVSLGLSRFRLRFWNKSSLMTKKEIARDSQSIIEGLTVRGPTYVCDNVSLSVLRVDKVSRRLTCVVEVSDPTIRLTRSELGPMVSYVLGDMYCVSADVLTKSLNDTYSGALVVNYRRVNFDSDIPKTVPIFSQFIM